MAEHHSAKARLFVAAVIFAAALVVVWFADSAMTVQYRYLAGCWPDSVEMDGQTVLTQDFYSDRIEPLASGPISNFFLTRMKHRILLYLIGACALIGWSGSIFLRIVRAARDSGVALPGWDEVVSSFVLALIGGGVSFLLLISGRLLVDLSGDACIAESYGYLAVLAGLASGMFVVKFFDWFEGAAKKIWSKLGRD